MKHVLALLFLCGILACKTVLIPAPFAVLPSNYYTETHRPQFHFSPAQHWMNDPNGLVWSAGEYHLFYQYYPGDIKWGPMHWGHAVTRDLTHWEHLPIALYPDTLGYIFSGSAVADTQNTAGFRTGTEAPLVAIFTYHDMAGEQAGRKDHQSQGIAYSNDRGRSWIKYAGNPVIANPGAKDFRDPKVFWHAATQRWVLILAQGDRVVLYTSPDLKQWTPASEFGLGYGSAGRPWECPDLFELPVAGTAEKRWVMLVSLGTGAPNGGSGTEYFIGQFDGKIFTPDDLPTTTLWFDYGRDNYAGVTWNNGPDDRRLFIGWMSNWQYAQEVPTTPWRSAMTVPRTLHLQKTPAGIRLVQQPVRELEQLRQGGGVIKLTGGPTTAYALPSAACEIKLEWQLPGNAQEMQAFGVHLQNPQHPEESLSIGYDPEKQQVFVDRSKAGKAAFSDKFAGKHTAPYTPVGTTLKMRLLVDASSVEVFIDDGALAVTEVFFPTEAFTTMRLLYTPGARPELVSGRWYTLKSVWR